MRQFLKIENSILYLKSTLFLIIKILNDPKLFYKNTDLEVDFNSYKDQIEVEKVEQKAKSPV